MLISLYLKLSSNKIWFSITYSERIIYLNFHWATIHQYHLVKPTSDLHTELQSFAFDATFFLSKVLTEVTGVKYFVRKETQINYLFWTVLISGSSPGGGGLLSPENEMSSSADLKFCFFNGKIQFTHRNSTM